MSNRSEHILSSRTPEHRAGREELAATQGRTSSAVIRQAVQDYRQRHGCAK
jgi:predicted transcriptional regulator